MMVDLMAMRDDDYDLEHDIIPTDPLTMVHNARVTVNLMNDDGSLDDAVETLIRAECVIAGEIPEAALAVTKTAETHMSALTGIALAMEMIVFGTPESEPGHDGLDGDAHLGACQQDGCRNAVMCFCADGLHAVAICDVCCLEHAQKTEARLTTQPDRSDLEKLLAREAYIQRWRGMESRCELSRENSMAEDR